MKNIPNLIFVLFIIPIAFIINNLYLKTKENISHLLEIVDS